MRYTRLNLVLLLLCLPAARANEGGGEKPAAVPRDQREYTEKTIKLNSLTNRLEDAEKHFAELVHEKNEAPTAEAKFPYLKEMVEVAKHRNADVTEYTKLKSELNLRYPNQGEHLNRHYRERSADELERDVAGAPSLDELLFETKRMIDRKYAPLDPVPKGTRAPAAVPAEPKPPRLRLER